MSRQQIGLSGPVALVLGVVLVLASGSGHAAKKGKTDEYVVTVQELQLELMSYADRYASIAAQALDDVERMAPPPETRRAILGDLVYSAAAAFTIAAEPDPQLALLDLVVMTTMGRLVFEDYWRPRLGSLTEPVIAAFEKLENDIWTVASPILEVQQQQELRERITAFRAENPDLSTFSNLRFADFPSKRESSTLKKKKSGGIFGTVKNITDQVEQTRLMAERAMYLSSRLPLLSGGFADVWMMRLSKNPAVEDLRTDLRTFAVVSERLAAVAEQLPEQISNERNETVLQLAKEVTTLRHEAIEHLLDRLAEERNATLEQLIAEEERLGGVLTELRSTLTEANTLTHSVDALAERVGVGAPPPSGEPAEPFDIEDYRQTIVEARSVVEELTVLVASATERLNSPGADRLVPSLVEAINEAGETSEDLVDHSFLRAALLILFALVGYVLARLGSRWLDGRVFAKEE
jgi:hypothetical protein